MAGRHIESKESPLKRVTRKQWMVVVAVLAALAMIVSGSAFAASRKSSPAAAAGITEYSVNDLKNGQDVSRSDIRQALAEGRNGSNKDTTYVSVSINGRKRLVAGSNFTTVKSVLEAGNITLGSDEKVSPSLNSKVTEATQVIISSTNSEIQTVEQSIPFNTIKKNDPTLAQGTTKVQTEGKEGTMEITNLVTKNGTKTLSSNTISEYVKTVPTNRIILVGTKQPEAPKVSTNSNSNSSSSGSNSAPKASSNNYGTTLAQGDYQSYAHSQVLARKWGEDQFTCLVLLWQRESGWRVNAANPSGAYGIPQALPGSKMGPGWQTDAKVQIDWGLSYIAGRYGTPCGAWGHSNATGWY